MKYPEVRDSLCTFDFEVVFVVVTDPVGSGFVKSLASPGSNATGFTHHGTEHGWQVARATQRDRAAGSPSCYPATAPYVDVYLKPFKAAAASLGLDGFPAPVHEESEFETIFAAQARTPNGGLVLIPDGFLNVHRVKITSLAAQYHLPAVYPWRYFAELGGLLSYGADQRDQFRLAATYADRILKGEEPSDLPVQARQNLNWL